VQPASTFRESGKRPGVCFSDWLDAVVYKRRMIVLCTPF
jgi:hypothetical protein